MHEQGANPVCRVDQRLTMVRATWPPFRSAPQAVCCCVIVVQSGVGWSGVAGLRGVSRRVILVCLRHEIRVRNLFEPR